MTLLPLIKSYVPEDLLAGAQQSWDEAVELRY